MTHTLDDGRIIRVTRGAYHRAAEQSQGMAAWEGEQPGQSATRPPHYRTAFTGGPSGRAET